jgi:glycosyltransferase involved in cell wall biosynthesis
MPDTFKDYPVEFIEVEGEYDNEQQINVGVVLDAIGRGKYSLSQCNKFLDYISSGMVKNGDVIYLQDFWTSGFSSILYALDLYNIKVQIYAMVHAQSVDEYDFTHSMAYWMRHYELGLDKRLSGIFVASTIHKQQLRSAGFTSPIHVVSLPINKIQTENKIKSNKPKKNVILFSSRLDKEKNPYFMLEVAKLFLDNNLDWEWHVTTSAKEFRSSLPNIIKDLYNFSIIQPRFKLLSNLSKEEYYNELSECKIQFNSSLQDYVSWTVIEATIFGADIVYPNFRSFKEFIPKDRLYTPFNSFDALEVINNTINSLRQHPEISYKSDLGRKLEGYIMSNNYVGEELNIWHEESYILNLLYGN